jgi:DNA-binding HxlR family transcriptional regulator
MPSPSSLRAIEEVYSLRILVTLLAEKKMYRSSLYQSLGAIRPVMSRLNHLIEVGLVKEIISEVPPFKKEVELTPQGMEVAKLLVHIEKILDLEP